MSRFFNRELNLVQDDSSFIKRKFLSDVDVSQPALPSGDNIVDSTLAITSKIPCDIDDKVEELIEATSKILPNGVKEQYKQITGELLDVPGCDELEEYDELEGDDELLSETSEPDKELEEFVVVSETSEEVSEKELAALDRVIEQEQELELAPAPEPEQRDAEKELKGGEFMLQNFINTLNNSSLNKNDKCANIVNDINGMYQVAGSLMNYSYKYPNSQKNVDINQFVEKFRRASADGLNAIQQCNN